MFAKNTCITKTLRAAQLYSVTTFFAKKYDYTLILRVTFDLRKYGPVERDGNCVPDDTLP